MVRKTRIIKNFNMDTSDISDFADLLEEEDIRDEDIARDMNLDVETVKSMKQDLRDEEVDGPSVFFKTSRHTKKARRKS